MSDKNSSERFSFREMEHVAVNYAISCEKGYRGSFRSYYAGMQRDWRKWLKNKDKEQELKIKNKKAEQLYEISNEIEIEKPIGDLIIQNCTGVNGADGVYYHYTEIVKLLKLLKVKNGGSK